MARSEAEAHELEVFNPSAQENESESESDRMPSPKYDDYDDYDYCNQLYTVQLSAQLSGPGTDPTTAGDEIEDAVGGGAGDGVRCWI